MSEARRLYDLQLLDLDIDSRTERVRKLEGQLGESEAVARVRMELELEQQQLEQLERSHRSLEWDANDLLDKVTRLEQRLYGGSVRNPKELSSLQEEVEHLKAHHRGEENKVLDIMIEIESLQESIRARSREAATLEEQHRHTQGDIRQEIAQLEAEIKDLSGKRARATPRINDAALELYEALRVARQGRAVARVEGGRCQGCRIALPTTELQRARSPQELVQCGSCGRILLVS